MITLICTIIFCYLLLIGSFIYGFDKVAETHLTEKLSKTSFSIIIPFRDEAKNLFLLLNSINTLEYPKDLFEFIFVNDDSRDNSIEIINQFINESSYNISLISNVRLSKSPKKDAITEAINFAKHNWIITTDADCVLPKYWLKSFDVLIESTHAKCVVAPVTISTSNNFLEQFQLLELLSLQGVTIGGFGIKKPFLCNGANFAYQKTLFQELNGFEGNNKIASGDDVFFLEKVVNTFPENVKYLKNYNAIIKTKPEVSCSNLISQRKRWAAKTENYNSYFAKLTAILVLLTNTSLVAILFLACFNLFPFKTLVYLTVIKFSIDYLLIYKSACFFGQKKVLINYPISFWVYPFFSLYIALSSFFGVYKWKGRTYKK